MTTFTATSPAAVALLGGPFRIFSPQFIGETELHGFVAVAVLGTDLEHATRAGLHDRYGDGIASLVINLRHPDLPAEYSLSHRDFPVIRCLAGMQD
jgi:hypothetical protein